MKIPVSTYRLQFNSAFDFKMARDVIPYLAELGVSDIYASPIFQARRGSSHGYDVVDMNQLNFDLGNESDFRALVNGVKKAGIGWLQDIVPNHMAFDGENKFLMDVLENGKNSEYYDFFDIEWNHFYESLSERLLAPFLGRHYSEALDQREIQLHYDDNGFHISYYSLKLPLKIESYVNVITHRLHELSEQLGGDHPDVIKFLGILYSLKNLPISQDERLGRYSQLQFIKRVLWELYSGSEEIRKFIDTNVRIFNAEKVDEDDLSLLDGLLSEQMFRLSFWKVATEELNYRRFFNINGLISLKIENEKVFKATHGLIFNLIRNKKITGLRIDHIDGLYDPTNYLKTLREKTNDIYIVVEKILEYHEELPILWAVQGTTGYDFLNYVNGIFVDENNGRIFNKIYYNFTGIKTSYESILYEKKKLIIEKDMTGDVDNVAHLLKRVSSKNMYGNDMTLYGLKKAIIEILAHFPVYRTYVRHDYYSDADRRYVIEAVRKASEMNPALIYELSFIEQFLLLECGEIPEEDINEWLHFVMRFQQLTGPLMAKGFEDTTLYVYNRILSLNDVGGSPDKFGVSMAEFQEFNLKRSRRQPHSMNATSTHDTKRGEDMRARLNVLSEIPDVWEENLKKWSKMNRRKKKSMKGVVIPDRNDEYFLYQTLIGSLPLKMEEFDSFKVRLKEYIIKAVREAKVHTAWLKPDSDYEENFMAFIDKILAASERNVFFNEFLKFQREISFYGIFNSLSQTLIKITAPGFPDFYQGTEFWSFHFVDPDNRSPVDFGLRMWLLKELKDKERKDRLKLIQELFSTKEDGRVKLYLIYKALEVRKKYTNLFERGNYIPLETEGKYQNNIIAYAWEQKPVWVVVIAPRFLTNVVNKNKYPFGREIWRDTSVMLPAESPKSWNEAFAGNKLKTGQKIIVGDIISKFPCALMISNE